MASATICVFAPRGALQYTDSALELLIGGGQCPQEILRPRLNAVFSLMPAFRGLAERFVIRLLAFLNGRFKTDESPNLVSGLIEQEQGKKPGHSSISIEERMNAKEIRHIGRNEKQFIDAAAAVPESFKSGMELFHELGRLHCGHGAEQNAARAVGPELGDLVFHHFPFARRSAGILV